MRRRATLVLLLILCLSGSACASGYEPFVSYSEHIDGLVYYPNGTMSYGMASGILSVRNPASTSPLSSMSVTLPNGTAIHIDHIGPGADHTVNYLLSPSKASVPLSLHEAIVPTSVPKGVPQQVRLVVELQNTGSAHITGFQYQKPLPSGLTEAWESHDGGSLTVSGVVTWTLSDLGPGERKNLTVAFNMTPAAGVIFPKSVVDYDYGSTLSGSAPGLTANTDTTFQVQKSHLADSYWMVNATVPDNSEFDLVLRAVSISRADASDPFNTVELESLQPNASLSPGNSWTTSLTDHFGPVPVYYLKIAYSMPYTTYAQSHVDAETAPITITVTTPAPAPSSSPSLPYATPTPTPTVTPTPVVPVVPDIVFVAPQNGAVITANSTQLETSIPPSGDQGYVAYYVSANNLTWMKLGQSQVYGTISQLLWNVPQLNSNYYLKAEHYSSAGVLMGVAYTQVLVAHETQPVGMTTMLISGTDWLMLIIALLAIMLLMFILLPYIRGRPVIYDASALEALSLEKDWMSKLPREAMRPDALLVEIAGMDKIRMRPLNNIAEMRRLETDLGLSAYDAMALQLAREVGATLVTSDPRIADIGKQLDVKVKLLEKVVVAAKA